MAPMVLPLERFAPRELGGTVLAQFPSILLHCRDTARSSALALLHPRLPQPQPEASSLVPHCLNSAQDGVQVLLRR